LCTIFIAVITVNGGGIGMEFLETGGTSGCRVTCGVTGTQALTAIVHKIKLTKILFLMPVSTFTNPK
jgi:hypothetical protein